MGKRAVEGFWGGGLAFYSEAERSEGMAGHVGPEFANGCSHEHSLAGRGAFGFAPVAGHGRFANPFLTEFDMSSALAAENRNQEFGDEIHRDAWAGGWGVVMLRGGSRGGRGGVHTSV
jgi:hypothetical protein